MRTKTFMISGFRNSDVKYCLAVLLLASAIVFGASARGADAAKPVHLRASEEVAKRQMLARLPGGNQLNLAIGLPYRNQQALSSLINDLYDPKSPKFHRYMTPADFTTQFGPTEKDYQSVLDFAKSNGLTVRRTYGNRALVEVSGNVSQVEKAFSVHIGNYQHPTENRLFFAPDADPKVPAGLPVLFINGMDNYFIPRSNIHRVPDAKAKPAGPRAPDGSDPYYGDYLGNDFRNAYVPGTTLTGAGQYVGMFELDGYTPGDIQKYETDAGGGRAVPLQNVLNTLTPGSGNDEVALDIEMAIAMAPGLKGILVYEEPNNGSGDATIINEMANPTQGEVRPSQISCSWGIENDTTVTQGLQQLAAQGQSFFYASGDNGAYQNGVNTGTESAYLYMTGVGGTELSMNGQGASWLSEKVWRDDPGTTFTYFSSTGGVLTQDAIPDYQKTIKMTSNQGSTTERNVPDVALVARDIFAVTTGSNSTTHKWTVTGQNGTFVGTSAAAPLWAGICALVNQKSVATTGNTVGFLNPALYIIAQSSLYSTCFHDITSGNNAWSNPANGGTSSDGLYNAEPGYDLCTGWGTPNTTALISELAGLTGPVFVDFNYTGSTSNGRYDTPFKTIAAAVSGVPSKGTIIIKTAGSSSETTTISKALTINASDGAGTIGH